MKKLHWTQTAAGKKKLSRIRKKAWQSQKNAEREETSIGTSPLDLTPQVKTYKRKPQGKRPNVDEAPSIKVLLESLFERAEEVQEAARQIADKLGLEM